MSDKIAEHVASRMEGSPKVLSCRRLPNGFANANYRLETSSGVYLMRDRINHSLAEVEFELDVHDWLSEHQFPAPAAVRFMGGDRWVASGDSGDSHIVLFEWLEGSEPEANPTIVAAIARALAELHSLPPPAGDGWRRPNPIGPQRADDLLNAIPPDASGLIKFFAEEWALLRGQLSEQLPSGLIHGDLFPDNTLFRGDKLVAILDFDDAAEDVFVFDVAMTVHGFCFPGEEWSPELADVFVKTYRETRPLNGAEEAAISTYLRWCPLAMMGWHLGELLRRPDERKEKRAAELARRITTMREVNWTPSP